jgi:hypothetical protein
MPQTELIQKRLRDEGDKLLALFDSLTPAQWQTVVYADSMTWTIKDVLAHQIAAEREFQFYGRDVLNGGRGAPEDLVINEFNNRSVAAQAERTSAELIEDFRNVRNDSIEFVTLIRADQFDWEGWHPFFGKMTLEDLFKLIYRHNMMHVRDIRHVLGNE